EISDRRRYVPPNDQVRRDVVARDVARPEYRIELRERQLAVGLNVRHAAGRARDLRIRLRGEMSAWERPPRERHQTRFDPAAVDAAMLEGEPHVAALVEIARDEAVLHQLVIGRESCRRRVLFLERVENRA